MVLMFREEREGQVGRDSTFIFHPKVPDNVMEACSMGSTKKRGGRRVWRAWNDVKTRSPSKLAVEGAAATRDSPSNAQME